MLLLKKYTILVHTVELSECRGETNSNPPYSTAYNIVFDPLLYFCPKLSPRWHGVLFFPKFGNFGCSSIISKIFVARFTIVSILSHFFGDFFQNFPALRAVLYLFQNFPPRFARCSIFPFRNPIFFYRASRGVLFFPSYHIFRAVLYLFQKFSALRAVVYFFQNFASALRAVVY